jgi:hypothetical protein
VWSITEGHTYLLSDFVVLFFSKTKGMVSVKFGSTIITLFGQFGLFILIYLQTSKEIGKLDIVI